MKTIRFDSYPGLFAIVATLLIVVAVFALIKLFLPLKFNDMCELISGIAALSGSILLYLTLRRQDRSFAQERFEITFFNALEQLSKVESSLLFYYRIWTNEHYVQQYSVKGADCFDMAFFELRNIQKSFSSKKYEGILDDDYDKSFEFEVNKITNDGFDSETIVSGELDKLQSKYGNRLVNRVNYMISIRVKCLMKRIYSAIKPS